MPTPEWQGKSGLNPYADFVMQTDAAVGAGAATRWSKAGSRRTRWSSSPATTAARRRRSSTSCAAKGHNPSYEFRGHKADIFEGGHRVPFIVRWPAQVKAGDDAATRSSA